MEGTKYIKDGTLYDGGVIHIDEYVIEEPTDEQMAQYGYAMEARWSKGEERWPADHFYREEEYPETGEKVIVTPTDEELIADGWERSEVWVLDGIEYDGGGITVAGRTVFNPSEEQLLEAGYEVYEPTDEELLAEAKAAKIAEIEAYDKSAAVNQFTLSGQPMWLSVEQREQVATQISASEAGDRETMTRWFDGHEFTYPVAAWKQMLTALELYAGDALNVTESHKAAVMAKRSVNAVNSYDYTTGYPDKLSF